MQLVAPPVGDQHLLAVAGHRVAAGRGQRLGLPIFKGEHPDLGRHVAGAPVELRAGPDEEHPVVARAQPHVVVELDGQPHHPPREAVEVDADRRRVLAVLHRVVIAAVLRRVVVLLLNRHLVALRRQRMGHVLPQGQRVDAGLAVNEVVPLERPELGRERAVRQVVEVLAIGVPGRVLLVEQVARHLAQLPTVSLPNVNETETGPIYPRAKCGLVRKRERQVAAPRGPDVVAYPPVRLVGD